MVAKPFEDPRDLCRRFAEQCAEGAVAEAECLGLSASDRPKDCFIVAVKEVEAAIAATAL
jgi:hypothetical protein